MIEYGKQRRQTVPNRLEEIAQRLARKYGKQENRTPGPATTVAPSALLFPHGGGAPSAPNSVPPGVGVREGDEAPARSTLAAPAAAQSGAVVRAMACDDGAPIYLQYDGAAVRRPRWGSGFSSEQSRPAGANGRGLQPVFESFSDPQGAPASPAGLSPHGVVPGAPLLPPVAAVVTPAGTPQRPEAGSPPAKSMQPRPGPSPAAPDQALASKALAPAGKVPGRAPDWNALDQGAAGGPEAPGEDTFLNDLGALLGEAKRRADAGQDAPALSPASAGKASSGAAPLAALSPAPPSPRAPENGAPAGGEAGGVIGNARALGTQAQSTGQRHDVFDNLGRQMQRAVTFDAGTVPVDKTFAAIEASIDAQEAQERRAARRAAQPRKPKVPELSPIEQVEDMALMTPEMSTGALGREAYTLSEQIPLEPGNGGRSISADALETGDLVVSTTPDKISGAIRRVTGSLVSHAMLYIGAGQVVEAIEDGVVLRSIEDAVKDSRLVVAFRHPDLSPEQALRIRDYAGRQLDKRYNWAILRHPAFLLDKAVFCRGKTGEDLDRCVNWYGRINIGTASNDRFYCSELVLKAYQEAGVPLTNIAPNFSTPGEIPELQQTGKLAYVGHLKYEP